MSDKYYGIQYVGTDQPRPQITRNGALLSSQGVVDELNALRMALTIASENLPENANFKIFIADVLKGKHHREQ